MTKFHLGDHVSVLDGRPGIILGITAPGQLPRIYEVLLPHDVRLHYAEELLSRRAGNPAGKTCYCYVDTTPYKVFHSPRFYPCAWHEKTEVTALIKRVWEAL